ncbi:MAG: diguanylate cyclase [Deltaproteobacteria bacterium]|jgi:two-component system cell cycle response regulator|nr:diguanylate cyclase [Deltaproteobacteria bacterium]MBW2530234.1 diguanylate cyclase [Deltaproteobacteria bacterium]
MDEYDPRPKVLVVDDTPMHRQIIATMLAERNLRIIEATGGMEGISTAFFELPDLVISDVMMPDISGYQLCRFLKNDSATVHIPIILMTATELGKQDRFWGLRSGADRYVAKDRVRDLLLDEVTALLDQTLRASSRRRARAARSGEPANRNLQREIGSLFDKLLMQTTIAHEARQLASFVHDDDKCLAELARLVGDLADFDCLCLHLSGPDGGMVHLSCRDPLSPRQAEHVVASVAERTSTGLPALDGDGFVPSLAEIVDEGSTAEPFGAMQVYPLRIQLDELGSLALLCREEAAVRRLPSDHLSLLAQEFAPVAQLLRMARENRKLSVTDGLTQLYNLRYFRRRLAESFENYRRYHRPFSVVLIDVDHFKSINDGHGHPAGDAALQRVAEILTAAVRKGDVVARYGGDEFALLLPETPVEGARTLAERLWQATRTAGFAWRDRPVPLTLSVGVAEMAAECDEPSAVLALADRALYEAKRAGRNAVRTDPGPSKGTP